MRFGLALHGGFPHDRFQAIVRQVERAGFAHLWIADEGLYRDPYTLLTTAALSSSHIGLGVGVTNPYTRHPALTAAAIATVDELSGGRTVLGLGQGGSAPLALPVPKPMPLKAVEDTVAIVNALTGTGKAGYRGSVHTFHGALDFAPIRRVPIFIGTRGPTLLQMAGALADGVILGSLATPTLITSAARLIHHGAREVGRDPDSLRLVPWVATSLSEEPGAALEAVRAYVAVAVITSRRLLPGLAERHLPPTVLDLLERNRWQRNPTTVDAVRATLTADLVEMFALAGPRSAVAHRIEALAPLGLDHVSILLTPPRDGRIEEQLDLFADVMRTVHRLQESAGDR